MLTAVPYLRLALAQINPRVGDIQGNADVIIERAQQAAAAHADLAVFPEMALTGSPVEDLALRDSFVQASRRAVADVADRLDQAGLGGLVVVVGYLDHAAQFGPAGDTAPVNAAAVLHRGKINCRLAKHPLAGDEAQQFASGGPELTTVRIGGVDVALTIGTDLEPDTLADWHAAGAGLLLVIHASGYASGIRDTRERTIGRQAREAGCPVAWVNAVGGQGERVFDGGSLVADRDGVIIGRAAQFVESLEVVDPDLSSASGNARSDATVASGETTVTCHIISDTPSRREQPVAPRMAAQLPKLQEIYQALLLGLRDYVTKNAFQRVVLGLSGGIDSALVAVLACDALGAGAVCGISNPSKVSPDHSRTDAADLARRTGLQLQTVPIAAIVDAFHDQLVLQGVAAENLQARIRGVIWMAESNQHPPSIVLACGNRSELAVGYSTIYGDAVGGFAPIKDVPKTMVWQLAHWRNQEAVRRGETPPIPENTITKEPSAELRPNQRDADSLPPYDVLDGLLDSIDRGLSHADLLAQGFAADLIDRVQRMVDAAEYKRRQYPPGPKINSEPFGRDRRLPIINAWREGSSN